MALICKECGHECQTGDAFCGGCGNKLGDAAPDSGPGTAGSTASRRPLTVMFCDLVGSTELSASLDPEELSEVLRLYHEMATGVIRQFEGYVAQYLGDGLLVYFGYPSAHEDDPARAVQTALGILRKVPALNERLDAELANPARSPLQVRIGIHSGPVVVGEVGAGVRTEQLATGETVNLAARLEGVARPGHAVVSATTAKLARGFSFQPAGTHQLKGIPEPVEVFEAAESELRDSGQLSRPAEGSTPLAGRGDIVARLASGWHTASQGQGRAVLLAGDAGVGKSRMVEELQNAIDVDTRVRLVAQASELHQKSAFYPLQELLKRGLRFRVGDSQEVQYQKLVDGLEAAGLDDESVALVAEMLSLGEVSSVPTLELSQAERRARTLQVLTNWALVSSKQRPLLVIVEDLHWLDPSTLDWLTVLINSLAGAPIFLLMTARPTFESPWSDDQVETIELDALSNADLRNLIQDVAGSVELPEMLLQQIIRRSDGVPLYAEEFTRAALESLRENDRTAGKSTLEIPDTLIASLTARLDRLGTAKVLAQLASVLGREFSHQLLEAVSGVDGLEFRKQLRALVRARLLHRFSFPVGVQYVFHHALIQKTAYESMLRRDRLAQHKRIAEVLREQLPEVVADQPELIAHHYDSAGEVDLAIDFYRKAGDRANAHHANQEAVAHFARALQLLEEIPESPERDHLEIDLQLGLGLPLSIVAAYSDEGVGQAYRRALELCRASDDVEPRYFEALYGLSRHHQVKSELEIGVDLGEELLERAERTGELDQKLAAHATLAQNLYWLGRFEESLFHAQAAIDHYAPLESKTLWKVLGTDPGVAARAFAGFALWTLGKPVEARAMSQSAIEMAQDLGHQMSEAYSTGFGAVQSIMQRDTERAKELGARVLQISDEPRLPIFWGQGKVVMGWARVAGDRDPGGIEDVQEGMQLLASLGTGVGAPGFMSVLAEVQARLGLHEGAVGVTGMGLATAEEKGQPQYVADLLTVRGLSQLALARGLGDSPDKATGISEAEQTLRQAVATAEQQKARSLGLRAWIALARCLALQGDDRVDEAREGLAAAYAGFEECDGVEHEEARTLLAELSSS